jgi:hypothetical protein
MGAALKLRDTDHGYKKMVEAVFTFGNPKILMGVLDGDRPHGDDAFTISDLAAWMEFGTENIEARSFIRAYFDEHEDELREELKKLLPSVLLGKRSKEQVLEIIGMRAVAGIQARISAGIAPPNKQSTIDRKGSSTPLIGKTGLLRASVTHKVVMG